MFISLQLHSYGGKFLMCCIYGRTSCRLSGRFSFEGWSCLVGEEKRATSGFGLKVILGGYIFV